MPQRTFHFIEGSSSKFWSIEVSGTKTLVHYGKIGTAGQAQEKEFASEAAATVAADKLITEKTRKGYVEQATAGVSSGVSQPKRIKPEPKKETRPAQPEKGKDAPGASLERRVCVSERDLMRMAWAAWVPLERAKPVPFDLEKCLGLLKVALQGSAHNFQNVRKVMPSFASPEEAWFWLGMQQDDMRTLQRFEKFEAGARSRDYNIHPGHKELSQTLLNSYYSFPAMCGLVRCLLSAADTAQLIAAHISTIDSGRFWDAKGLGSVACEGFAKHVAPWLTAAERLEVASVFSARLHPGNSPEINAAIIYLISQVGGSAEQKQYLFDLPDGSMRGRWNSSGEGWGWYLGGLKKAEFAKEFTRLHGPPRSKDDAKLWVAATGWENLQPLTDEIKASSAKVDAEALARELALVEAPEVAPEMLQVMNESKAASVALEWFADHPALAIAGLVPTALASKRESSFASIKLREMLSAAGNTVIDDARAFLSAEEQTWLRQQISETSAVTLPEAGDQETPPDLLKLLSTHARVKSFAWLTNEGLPPLPIGDKRLSSENVSRLITALVAGDAQLTDLMRTHFRAADVDAFVWHIFTKWMTGGAPSRDKWGLLALGHLGSDAIALKLAPLVRKWPGESQHQRAVTGLQVLRNIGTDTALMQLNGIAQKVPFKGLKERARELMEEIAKDRGLTKAQLEDRIVPDCGLDARGTRTFDFGPRQFEFLLGSDLKPAIREASGKKRPDLPAPNAQDDPALSSQAVDDWKLLKKTLREILKIQTTRMEQAMVTGRRWTAEEFEMLLLRHPLMTHLARWVVWACYGPDGRPVHTFRVTEDQTLADSSDDTFVLPKSAGIGIVHPFHLTDAEKNAWGQVFGDYEIIQPFPQLSRPVLTLTKAETSGDTITRAAGRKIPAGSLFGVFEKGGWQRDMPADGGGYSAHSKQFPAAGLTAFAHYDPGLWVGGSMAEMDDQDLTEVYFVPGLVVPDWWSHHKDRIPLSKVDPIALSEVLADVETLIGKAK